MLPAISSKLSLPVAAQTPLATTKALSLLRCAAVLAQLVGLGALAVACSAGDPAGKGDSAAQLGRARAALAGTDGSVTISAAGTVVNRYTTLGADVAANATSIKLTSVAALAVGADALATGDLLLLIQMQGATIETAATDATWGQVNALGGAGLYEMVEVLGVDAANNTVTLSCALKNAYSVAGATQVVRVPQYDSLTISSGASITAPAWNGTVGGVVAVHAKSTVTLTGDIDVSALGFRGGITDDSSQAAATDVAIYASTDAADGARKGEGIAGTRTEYGRAPAANGGGGGNSHNGGGGGGSNGKFGGAWTGQGVFNTADKGGVAAWPLDPNYSATGSQGGGRGGYTYSANDANATTTGPGKAAWGGNNRRERGGLGGHPLDNDVATRVFMGGGGGAGDGNNGHAGRGGIGGGIVFVRAATITGAGRILANGEAGVTSNSTAGGSTSGDAPGGGGGGGSVVVRATTVAGFSVQANGGVGGNQLISLNAESEGPGGGGGGGFVSVSGTITASAAGGVAGTTSSTGLSEFPVNGATDGGAGLVQLAAAATGSIPYCVDSTAPDTTITSAPTGTVSDNTGDFTFTSTEAGTFECSLDAGAFAACTTPFTTAPLADGSHTLQVRAKDTIGNVDPTPATATWTVDTTAPNTTIATGPAATVAAKSSSFTFTSNEDPNVTYECRIDAGTFAACTTPFTSPQLADGAHTLDVRAKDLAGNVDATPATWSWTIDSGAPDTLIDTGPTGATADSTPTFTFHSTENGSTFECSVDSGAFAACATPFTPATALAEGPHTFAVRAKDSVGNTDASPATASFTVDTTAPDTQITSSPPNNTQQTSGNLVFKSPDDANATFECSLDGATFASCDTPLKLSSLSVGAHTFAVRAVDAVGNADATPASVSWTIKALDSDGDGLSDVDEIAIGTNPNDADSDDDGVPDGSEISPDQDTDGDGLINALDPDSDNDGLFDGTELGLLCDNPATDLSRGMCRPDADHGATTTDPLKADTDGGGATDGSEDSNLNGALDAGETDPTAGHGADDASVVDTDGDGLSDALEHTLHSDPQDKDSDDDGVPDGLEPNPSADGDHDGVVDVIDVDSDNDGLFDGTEMGRDCSGPGTNAALGHCRADADPNTKTSAVNPDTDRGGVTDGNEDFNLDGKLDAGETNPVAGQGADDGTLAGRDTDGDGLSDQTEATLGSDPNDADSDDDGLLDGAEPNPSDDQDGDHKPNILDSDSDGDGLFDGTEAGKDCANAATNTALNQCIADADAGATQTGVLTFDTDYGGVSDGAEDTNKNGAVDPGETDPLNSADDVVPGGEGGAGGAGGAGELGGSAGAPVVSAGGTSGGGTATGGETASGGETAAAGEAGAEAGGAAAGGSLNGSGGSESGGNGSGGTSGGGTSGGSESGGSSSGGTSSGGVAGSGVAGADQHVVVLGGGLCSFRPATAQGAWSLLVAACVVLTAQRRRANRRKS